LSVVTRAVMRTPLSLRAYAAWRKDRALQGGNLQAVQKAIQRGRLAESVILVDGVKKIADPELADREWEANTDPLQGVIGFRPDNDAAGEPPEIVKASTRLKQAQADQAELKYRLSAGQLMDVEDAESEWSEFCAQLRSTLLGLPNRLKQRHPDIPLEHLATLEELLRADLEDLADEDPDDEPS
jgi:phage terminase Nu1 subunit (DNA packaging protein)